MAYIKETISNYGTQYSYLVTLRDFFVNNSVAPFELITDLSEENLNFVVERNNLNLTFSTTLGQVNTKIIITSKVKDEVYSETSSHIAIAHSVNENSELSIGREIQLLLVKNEDTILIQIAAHNAPSVSKGTTILDTILSNGMNLIGVGQNASGGTTIALKETSTQNTYTVRPFHTGSNDETSIILSNTLAVNNNSGVYFADMNGLKSAGGAKQFGYYVTNSDTYYGVFTDVCIPLGDRVEYVSE